MRTGNTKYSISTSGELMNQKRKSAKREENQKGEEHIPIEIVAHTGPPPLEK